MPKIGACPSHGRHLNRRKLHAIDHSLARNRVALHVARANLKTSQRELMQRLRVIYTQRDAQSTAAIWPIRDAARAACQFWTWWPRLPWCTTWLRLIVESSAPGGTK